MARLDCGLFIVVAACVAACSAGSGEARNGGDTSASGENPKEGPAPFVGLFEIDRSEEAGKIEKLREKLLQMNPNLVFGRMLIEIEADRVSIYNQLLQLGASGGYQACEVRASASVSWSGDKVARPAHLSAQGALTELTVTGNTPGQLATNDRRFGCNVSLSLNQGATLTRSGSPPQESFALQIDFDGKPVIYHLVRAASSNPDFSKWAKEHAGQQMTAQ